MIKEVKEVSEVEEVNKLLEEGWKLLNIISAQPKAIYILGFSKEVCNY